MSEAGVSVVIPVYNGEPFLAECLESVLGQTLPPLEAIVVDDGSTDTSTVTARRFPGVRVIEQEHAGVAVARNTGIAAARGDLIAFIDQDDRWVPGKLAVQVPVMRSRPELRFTLTHLRVFVEGDGPPPSWLQPAALERPLPGCVPGALLVRAETFAQIGWFDPACGDACDADWFFRARDAGIPHLTLPEVLLEKRTHSANTSAQIKHCQETMFEAVKRSVLRRRTLHRGRD